jgi:galactitol-specific phosphotransferase system IIB component
MAKKTKALFLVACGTAIATSTMVSEILRDELVRKKKHNIDFIHCSTMELVEKARLINPDVIITTVSVEPEWRQEWESKGIIYFKGTPLLTGIGEAELQDEIEKVVIDFGC